MIEMILVFMTGVIIGAAKGYSDGFDEAKYIFKR